jgi:transcriptional regulator with XRE-family HTH domain
MSEPGVQRPRASAFGGLLREWRGLRRMSQLDLSVAAGVSPRHLSFVETGRAVPSRDMVLTLSRALEVPLRERNAMLQAAGYAPAYRETNLAAPEMAQMLHALQLLLCQQEPFAAVAMDRRWDVVMCNRAYARFFAALGAGSLEPLSVLPPPRVNALRTLLEEPLKSALVNWDEVARNVLDRAVREGATDPVRRAIVEELLALPGIPSDWRHPRLEAPAALVVPIELRIGGHCARLFTTIATLGTAQDITLQELNIETFHPADASSEALARAIAG